jgi:hypothetical protein
MASTIFVATLGLLGFALSALVVLAAAATATWRYCRHLQSSLL